ncbi:NapC/NirT family cytochrome c [Carboxylicivirga marina]|uniref:NapC/NirT family cytochrome c n=1 Tax=Carboxylicivirga marina TaxID=2800988 RepID=UPI002591B1C8|nr:NapC/NirT family cytochrome c [uncultured Carboxylicivirga sp.]
MKKSVTLLLMIISIFTLLSFLFTKVDDYTSSNHYCNSCHVHDHAHSSWMQSVHHYSSKEESSCVDCHLPPKGHGYYKAKIHAGFRDIHAFLFKDSSEYNWQKKSHIETAKSHTFKQSCLSCHDKLFPIDLPQDGELAHWHYLQHQDEMHCVQCHINVGHGADAKASRNFLFLQAKELIDTIYETPATIDHFESFTERIPQSDISFKMIAVKDSPLKDYNQDTIVSDLFIAEIETSWEMYQQFLSETESEGRKENETIDGISGATPPWGNPDQGWGLGQRPAITMTHYAASVFCQWLSKKTNKSYRLPTELEWEYVANLAIKNIAISDQIANTNQNKTTLPDEIVPDNLGLKHLFGNVKEFCSNNTGSEHIIKGGSFKNRLEELSPEWRGTTHHSKWLKTDPQIPKSIWWYSDCNDVGFRVVLSYQPEQRSR